MKGVTELRRAKIAATEEGTLGGDTVLHVINGETALQKSQELNQIYRKLLCLFFISVACVSNG